LQGWRALVVAAIALATLVSGVLEMVLGAEVGLVYPGLLAVATIGSVRASRLPATRPSIAFMSIFIALLWVGYAVLVAFLSGLRIPLLFQNAAIVWPQLIFFGHTLWSAQQDGGTAFPHALAGFVTVGFWAVIGIIFATSARLVTSFPILVVLAGAAVIGTYVAVKTAVPFLGWRFLLEFP
jgi:hypothetical protein